MDRSVYFRFKAMELQVYCIVGQKITIWMIIFTGGLLTDLETLRSLIHLLTADEPF